jgi:hypothetical protein
MINSESAIHGLRRRRSFGIQARLVVLILVTVLPLVALSTFAILRTVGNERSQIERDIRESLENLLADVDREIRSVQVSLQILASSPSLQQGGAGVGRGAGQPDARSSTFGNAHKIAKPLLDETGLSRM